MIVLDDVRLPEEWSRGSAGGPTWLTDEVQLGDGDTYLEQRWEDALHSYEIIQNLQTTTEVSLLRAFFNARRGKKRAFLMKDWLDFTSAPDGMTAPTALDCPLGTGDGVATDFQLIKRYADAVNPWDRIIAWPVAGTLLVAADGVEIGAGVTVDRGTGVVTIAPAPAVGVVLTAGFRFDVPVHFVNDAFTATYDNTEQRSLGTVPIMEVRAWL